MYHPYQHLEAKQIVKERREHADMARRVEQARGDRTRLFSRLRARLGFLMARPSSQVSIGENSARSRQIDARVPGLVEE
jgi:hypothetical protein